MQQIGLANISSDIRQSKPVRPTKPLKHAVDHARVWAFADKHAVDSLKELACSYLAQELTQWTRGPGNLKCSCGGHVTYVAA